MRSYITFYKLPNGKSDSLKIESASMDDAIRETEQRIPVAKCYSVSVGGVEPSHPAASKY